jgi:hypothetical protein
MEGNRVKRFPRRLSYQLALLSLGVFASQLIRSGLAGDFARARIRHDVYALPSPRQAIAMSLGYRAALAELLFAHVLVESGLHLQQHRRFETLTAYLTTVIELEPKFATPYRMADTLLTFQVGKPTLRDFKDARMFVERGMRELPFDQEVHLVAGQYLAYLAAPHIADLAGREEAERWRLAGARALARSCELIGHDENIPYHCITAARLFDAAGERQAMQRFLERILAINDDEEIRRMALGYLGRTLGDLEREDTERRFNELDGIRKADLPFVGKNRYLLLPPHYDPCACVGYLANTQPKCATSLFDWHQRTEGSAR